MTYEEGILGIPGQFGYQPEIIHKEKIKPFKKVVVLGMGGSRLAGDILHMLKPEIDLYIHSDYDLPLLGEDILASSLIVANSYSGNTEEVISGAKIAIDKGYNLAIISTGGELLNLATDKGIPHIILPNTESSPRIMIGHDLIALFSVADLDVNSLESARRINAGDLHPQGTQIARQIGSGIPLVYTSQRFNELGYIWKIILNETAKMPAFHNRFPEADHNEIAGFRVGAAGFHALFLRDELDQRLVKRMDLTAELFRSHGMAVAMVPLVNSSIIEQIISSVITAHWTAFELALMTNVEPSVVSEIEHFKQQLHD